MMNERSRSKPASWSFADQLLTDSMILSETYVDSIIRDERNENRTSVNDSRRVLKSSILSQREDLLFWIMIALALLAVL